MRTVQGCLGKLKVAGLFFIEFHCHTHHSIALKILYKISFERNSIRRKLWPQIPGKDAGARSRAVTILSTATRRTWQPKNLTSARWYLTCALKDYPRDREHVTTTTRGRTTLINLVIATTWSPVTDHKIIEAKPQHNDHMWSFPLIRTKVSPSVRGLIHELPLTTSWWRQLKEREQNLSMTTTRDCGRFIQHLGQVCPSEEEISRRLSPFISANGKWLPLTLTLTFKVVRMLTFN